MKSPGIGEAAFLAPETVSAPTPTAGRGTCYVGRRSAFLFAVVPRSLSKASPRAAGFTLIEVLVALLITALGVLGLVAANLNALKFNQTADVRSHANLLAYDIVDRMRANRFAARTGDYDLAITAGAPTGNDIAELDLRDWLSNVAGQLPAGDGSVTRDGTRVTITVQWDESRMGGTRQANADGDHIQTFVYVTEF